jgi:hypothetical protein
MIACIICGGVGETMLIIAGLTWLLNWLKKRHNKNKCKCCQDNNLKDNKDV